MLVIQNILISSEILEEYFQCNLNACKGACCWEGEFGAPLAPGEAEILADIYRYLRPYLHAESRELIDRQGTQVWYEQVKTYGTPLLDNGACVFLIIEENGVGKCGIEKAWEHGAISFQKPISCHLYPVRIFRNEDSGFESLNYDRWDICSAACGAGRSNKIPLFRFVKNALIRRYGPEFFEELEAAYQYLKDSGYLKT